MNQDEALQKLRDKAKAYRTTFLDENGKLQPYAKIIMDDLNIYCGETKEGLHLDKEGRVDPFASLYRNGRHDVLKRIKVWLRWSDKGTIEEDFS